MKDILFDKVLSKIFLTKLFLLKYHINFQFLGMEVFSTHLCKASYKIRECKTRVLGQIHHIGNFHFINRFANEFGKETIKWTYTSKQ